MVVLGHDVVLGAAVHLAVRAVSPYAETFKCLSQVPLRRGGGGGGP